MFSGANFQLSDLDGNSPVMVAASNGYKDIVNYLQESGADMKKVNRKDLNILHLSAQFDRYDVIQMLAGDESVRQLVTHTDMYENTPLHIASKMGFTNSVKELLKNEFETKIDQKNEDEKTAIHLASAGGHDEVLKLLLKKDPNGIRDKDEENNTPLHIAATNKMTQTLQVLLDQGYLVHEKNKHKWTPLDCAAPSGAYKCAVLLLKYGSPVDPRDRNSTTPLHLASTHGHHRIVQLLLDSGADLSIQNDDGKNALELAIVNRKRNAAKAIIDDGSCELALKHICNEKDSSGESIPTTPLRMLIRVFPDLAEEVLDKCKVWRFDAETQFEKDECLPNTHEDASQVVFDFQYLDDTFSIRKTKGKFAYTDKAEDDITPYHTKKRVTLENHPLMIMVREQRPQLLRHPVCLALMRYKWKSVERPLFYFNLILYLSFLTLLTLYTVGRLNYRTFPGNSAGKEDSMVGCKYLVLVSVILLIGGEIGEMYRVRTRFSDQSPLFCFSSLDAQELFQVVQCC